MNLTLNQKLDQVKVVLSRRNLMALLQKLDMPGSARTIVKLCEHDVHLVVQASEDEEHYQGRTPGEMHPVTEAAITRAPEPDLLREVWMNLSADKLTALLDYKRFGADEDAIRLLDHELRAARAGAEEVNPNPSMAVTRFEVIDHTTTCGLVGRDFGRVLSRSGITVTLSYQDAGRTLKVFLGKP